MSRHEPPRRPAPPRTTRPRGRVSQQRYLMRRIGAVAVLVLFGGLVAKVGGALFGADGTEADGVEGTETTTANAQLVDDVDVTAADATTDPGSSVPSGSQPPGSTEPGTVDTTPHVPSAADPAKLLIAGDSDAGTFGPYLQTLLGDTGVVQTTLDYKVSTGLARPDQLDWPARFREIIPSIDPDIVVVTFGGNDAQGLSEVGGNFVEMQPTGEPGGDQDWRVEYGKRVGEVMDYLSSEGRTLIWVGIPNDDNPDVTARMKVQDEVVRAEAAKRPQVQFVDTWKRFSGRDGNWAEYVIDPRDGQGKDVRADDGFHLNVAGAEILALDIAEVVRQELVNRGAAL